MKWLKYPIQIFVMFSDLFIIAAIAIIFIWVPSPANIILGMGAIFMTKWVNNSDHSPKLFYSWKKENRDNFFKYWDALCDGKIHREIIDGKEHVIIDAED